MSCGRGRDWGVCNGTVVSNAVVIVVEQWQYKKGIAVTV